MDDSGTVVVAATNARLAIVAGGLSWLVESAAAPASSVNCSMVLFSLWAPKVVSWAATSRYYCETPLSPTLMILELKRRRVPMLSQKASINMR